MVLSELWNGPGFIGTTERLLCWFGVHKAKPLLTLGPEDGNSTTRPREAEVGPVGSLEREGVGNTHWTLPELAFGS